MSQEKSDKARVESSLDGVLVYVASALQSPGSRVSLGPRHSMNTVLTPHPEGGERHKNSKAAIQLSYSFFFLLLSQVG